MRLDNCRDRRRRMCAFYCTYCRKAFSTRQARRNHLSVHQEEVKLRRCLYRSHCSGNPTDNSVNVLIPSMPLFNLEASPSSFSQDNSLVNVDNNTTNNPANANSHLIVPLNPSFNGGSTKISYSSCSSTAPGAQIGDGTTSLNTPLAFSSCGGTGNEVSSSTAAGKQTSHGGKPISPANPLQNRHYPNFRNKKPYAVDVPEHGRMTHMSRRRQVTRPPETVQSEDRPKKELLLFKDVSCIVISSDAEEEVQIDLDLSLHL